MALLGRLLALGLKKVCITEALRKEPKDSEFLRSKQGCEYREFFPDARENTADVAGSQNQLHGLFLDFPRELILNVVRFLDQDSQVLLSLTCKQFRDILSSDLYLAFVDRAVKIQFLQVLELDHPEYLTCRSCAMLYQWKRRSSSYHWCPRESQHSLEDRTSSHSWYMEARLSSVRLKQGIIDLILRAHEYGQNYGLPLSYLNKEGADHRGVSHTNEARIVDDQLILAKRMEIELMPGQDMAQMWLPFGMACCHHMFIRIGPPGRCSIWQKIESAVADLASSRISESFKCSFCETDYELSATKVEGGRMQVIMNVWRNYRRRHGKTPSTEQH